MALTASGSTTYEGTDGVFHMNVLIVDAHSGVAEGGKGKMASDMWGHFGHV